MNAAELRALADRLKLTDPLFRDDYAHIAQAAEIIELIAWAEDNKVETVWRRHGYSVHVGLTAHNGDTLIDTLRRALEAAR